MYNKLPVKERIELMKSYRKANKDMFYRDMVKDYNDSYQRFDKGGEFNDYTQPGPLATEDSHDSYGFSFPESFEKTKSILERKESSKDLDFYKKYKIDRDSPYNSKLKFEHNPNIDYGLNLSNPSSSISAGVKFLDNNPQYNISANKTLGNFTGNVNSSFATNPQNNVNLNYNNKGLNIGAGLSRKDMENVYRANVGYGSDKFGVNANYAYNKNSENSHLLDVNANANIGNFLLSGNYGYTDAQQSGGLNLNYNKNNLGVGVGANYNENNGVGANFNISKKFEYGGIQQFDNGGKYDFAKDVKLNQVGPRVEEDLYSNFYNTVETPKNLSELSSYRAYTYGANQYYAPISHPQKGLEGVLAWDEKTGTNYQLNPANYKPYKEIPMTGDKSANLRRFVLDVAGEGQQQTADLYRTKSGNVENTPTRAYNTDEIKQNVFKELYAQNLFKFKGNKDAAFGATREFVEKNVEPQYGEYYKFKQDPEHYKVLGQYSDTNLSVPGLISNLVDKHIQGKNLNQEELNSIIKGEEFAKTIEEYRPALRDYFKTGKNLSLEDTDELINKSFNEYYQSQQPQKQRYGGIQKNR